MDEGKLAELLRDTVADVPPPTFDEHDVAAESERQRVRARNRVLTGSAFGVVLLASATALGVALWTGAHSAGGSGVADNAAAGSNGNSAPYELPQEGSAGVPGTERKAAPQDAPSEKRKQGRPPSGDAGPAGPGGTPSGCEQADRELAAALAGELPAAANVEASEAVPVALSCPSGSAGAAFPVPGGTISAVLLRPDVTPPSWALKAGTVVGRAMAGDRGTVVLVSEPSANGGAAPYGKDVQRFAEEVGRTY